MATFVPEFYICCENCNEIFYKYTFITNVFDTDTRDDTARAATSGIINRITCPHCNKEFTYETPILMFSYTSKIASYGCYEDLPLSSRDFRLASEIAGGADWNLRLCTFTMEASEKIRIFKDGLNDLAIEIIKLKEFSEYRNMSLCDEYITYEENDGKSIFFTKRNDLDEVLENYRVPFEKYNLILKQGLTLTTGDWIAVDRDTAIRYLEESK